MLSSCGALLSSLYGVKRLKKFDEEGFNNFKNKFVNKSTITDFFISSKESFKVYSNTTKDYYNIKNKSQPIQILYFENDSLISFHANCYAKGTAKNLNWNTDNRFETFPPKSAVDANLNIRFSIIKNIYPQLNNTVIKNKKKYAVVFFWTNVLEKISHDAINQVYLNIEQHNMVDSVQIITLNNDNSFIE